MTDQCNPTNTASGASGDRCHSKRQYTCHTCGAKLSRLAHLHRHQLQHFGPKETFQCHLCDKEFSRKDVHQRHLRDVHGPSHTSRRKGWKKTCQRCIRHKLKCTRDLPCAACSRSQATCTYEPQTVRELTALEQKPTDLPWEDATQSPSALSNINELSSSPANAAISIPNDGRTRIRPHISVQSPSATTCLPFDTDGHSPAHVEPPMPYEPTQQGSMNVVQGIHAKPSLPGWAVHTPIAPLSQQPECASMNECSYPWMDNMSLDLEALDNSILRAPKVNWLEFDTHFVDQRTSQPLPGNEVESLIQEPRNEDLMTHSMQTGELSNGANATGLGPSRPNPSDEGERTTWPGILDRGGNELWPFDYTSNKGFRKIKLPPLQQVLEQTVGDLPVIKTSTVKDLIKVLSAPLVQPLDDSPSLEALPAVAFLGQLAKKYFAEFHPILPLVHIPTWRIEKCPPVFLAAIACIGATYSVDEGSQEVAALLAEITQRTLFWMGQVDSRSFRSPTYISASCLHQIYALGSGNRRLYELADASRGLLVTGLRESGVFSSDAERSDANKINFQGLKAMDVRELELAWLRWRDSELERRIAWSVFEFDCTLSTLTDKRGAFKISELPTKLPCSESLWDAPSANAWTSVVSFSTSPPGGIPFYPLLRSIIAQEATLESIPAWARRICTLAISRLIWDLREMEDAGSPDIVGLASLADSHKATRETLLKCMMCLSDSLTKPTCAYDVINMNIACLTSHFANLSSSNQMMDLVTFIFRNNYAWEKGPSASQLNKELTRARELLRLRFVQSPVETRRAVYHAALVVTISQECRSYIPCETMRVFFSFAFLLAFNKLFPFDQQSPISRGASPIRLDYVPLRTSLSADATGRLGKWIQRGGPASLNSVEDICDHRNFEALKEMALKAMDSLCVWGLAKKFHRILSQVSL